MAMSPRLLRPRLSGDPDALRYIAAVQAADQQSLEPAVRKAFTDFIVGCKQDGTWPAIKASCILMGARTLAGALTPLVGSAPTNNGPFVSGDYNRETGLVGDGVGKYLDSGRNSNAEPQDSFHQAVYVTTAQTVSDGSYIGCGGNIIGASTISVGVASDILFWRNRVNSGIQQLNSSSHTGLIGTSRSSSGAYTSRSNSLNTTRSFTSQTPFNGNTNVYTITGASAFCNGRIAFYSVGESINLALLDSRVTTLYNAIAAAI